MKCCHCESDSLPKSFLISVSVKQFPRSLKSLLRSLISNVCDKKKKKESMKIQLFLEPENIIWRKKNQQTREKIEEKKFRICRIFFFLTDRLQVEILLKYMQSFRIKFVTKFFCNVCPGMVYLKTFI